MIYQNIIFFINCIVVFIALKKLIYTNWYILSLSYVLSMTLHLFGSYYLLYNDNWWIRYVSDESLKTSFLLTQSYALIFSFVIIFKKNNIYKVKLSIRKVVGLEDKIFQFLTIFCIIGALFIFKSTVLYNFLVSPDIDKLLLATYRNELTFSTNMFLIYFKNIFLEYLSILIFCYYSIKRYSTKNEKFGMMFFLSLFVVVFGALMMMSKAPIINVVLLYLFLKFVYGKEFKQRYFIKYIFGNYKKHLVSILMLLIIMFGITKGFGGDELLIGISNRIFISQHVGLPNAIEFFPNNIDFLGVTSISPSVSQFLGIEYNKFSRILMESVNPRGVDERLSGYLSSTYLAESYAIGGLSFVFISIALVLFLLTKIDNIYQFSNYPLIHSIYALLFIKLPFLINDSFKGVFFNVPLIIVCAFVLLIHFLNKNDIRYKNTAVMS